MQNIQRWQLGLGAIHVALLILSALILYMFYARLRDIADELRHIRIAYEMANERKSSSAPLPQPRANEPPADARYMPKQ